MVTYDTFLQRITNKKFTGLKFGTDGSSVICFRPNTSLLTENFSFSLWIKAVLAGSSPVAFAYKQDELFMKQNGGYRLSGKSRNLSNSTPVGVWQHYCGTGSLASKTFTMYINGTLTDRSTTFERKLNTGGTLVLGDYWDASFRNGISGNQFGGEMFNFNMFSKDLSSSEVAEIAADGLSAHVPEGLEAYRVVKWEEILKLPRIGTVQDIEIIDLDRM